MTSATKTTGPGNLDSQIRAAKTIPHIRLILFLIAAVIFVRLANG